MADNNYYVTAGLPRAKDAGQSPSAGVNTYYVTAGLPKQEEAAGAAPTAHLYGPLVGPLAGPV